MKTTIAFVPERKKHIPGLHTLRKSYSSLRSDLRKLNPVQISALPRAVRAYLAEPISVKQAEEEVRNRLRTRERNFLDFARVRVYEQRESPYRRLLGIAGCEYADLEREVQRQGLEKTLERLAGEGVYLTSAEYKGKKPVVRGQEVFSVTPRDFDCSEAGPGFSIESSGTSNRPMRSFRSLDRHVRAISMGIFLSAHGLFSYSHAFYEPILPAGGGLTNLLIYAKFRIPTERWFACRAPLSRFVGWYGQLTTQMIVRGARQSVPDFPKPEVIDTTDTHRIVRWIEEKRHTGKSCCVTCTASNAARIARVAWDTGVCLDGTKFVVGGEPFTKAKKEAIKRVGAHAASRFSSGLHINSAIGYGCANPLHDDEVHVHEHAIALVARPQSSLTDNIFIDPLMITTLHPSAGKFLLNVENGDYATMDRRDCGCAYQRVGLGLHVHHVRSFEKFTSEGMNYYYGDLFELFEKNLPAEFGGGPGDYQLVEEEDGNGQTRLTLRIHPDVKDLDEGRLLARLRAGLANGSRANRFMTGVWENAGTFRIERQVPYASLRGKILPLHIPQKKTTASDAKASLPRTPA